MADPIQAVYAYGMGVAKYYLDASVPLSLCMQIVTVWPKFA